MSWRNCTLLLAVVLSIVWKVNCEQRCPPASMVSPCKCHTNSSMTLVTCDGIEAPQDLEDLTKRIPGWRLDLLQFTNCKMMFIPSAILKGARFKTLEIADSIFQNLFDSKPTKAYFEKLVLRNIVVNQGFDFHLISYTGSKILHISGVPLPVIHDRLFHYNYAYPMMMTDLRLVNTRTTDVLSRAFSDFVLLRYFALTKSGLRNITRDAFPVPWERIRTIDLGDNLLESIPIDLFDGMQNLYNVVLENNAIVTIPELTASSTSNLQGKIYLQFRGNKIHCGCKMKWISRSESSEILISGVCATPSNFYGKPLNSLIPEDFRYC